ncbi:MAG: preprotein translocase subunit SecG [Armatimonadetes bacterium]|nr:preprotein translocase subunit SecG [Armatimonadota bacterium]
MVYNVVLVIAIILAAMFTLLVIVTGKGDAMSGGSGVRTTFKGKQSFDDLMSRVTLILGSALIISVVILDAIANRMPPK